MHIRESRADIGRAPFVLYFAMGTRGSGWEEKMDSRPSKVYAL